jgi:hypothetical protein
MFGNKAAEGECEVKALNGYSSDRNHYVLVRLDFETGEVDAYENHQANNGTPVRQWHGHARTWKLPAGLFSCEALDGFAAETEELRSDIVASYSSEWDGHNHVGRVDSELVEKFGALVEAIDVVGVWQIDEWLEHSVSSRRFPLISIDGCKTRVHYAYAETPRGRRRVRALVREVEALLEEADEVVEGDAEEFVLGLVDAWKCNR